MYLQVGADKDRFCTSVPHRARGTPSNAFEYQVIQALFLIAIMDVVLRATADAKALAVQSDILWVPPGRSLRCQLGDGLAEAHLCMIGGAEGSATVQICNGMPFDIDVGDHVRMKKGDSIEFAHGSSNACLEIKVWSVLPAEDGNSFGLAKPPSSGQSLQQDMLETTPIEHRGCKGQLLKQPQRAKAAAMSAGFLTAPYYSEQVKVHGDNMQTVLSNMGAGTRVKSHAPSVIKRKGRCVFLRCNLKFADPTCDWHRMLEEDRGLVTE